jgi:hypothetical protein
MNVFASRGLEDFTKKDEEDEENFPNLDTRGSRRAMQPTSNGNHGS